jgi:hypothetical protein
MAAEGEETQTTMDAMKETNDAARRDQWNEFGWKVNPTNMFSMNYGNLEVILDAIGTQMQVQEKKIQEPPWLAGLLKNAALSVQLVEENTEMRKELSNLKNAIQEVKNEVDIHHGGDSDEEEEHAAGGGGGGGGGAGGGGGDGGVAARAALKEVKHLKLELSSVQVEQKGQEKKLESQQMGQKLDYEARFAKCDVDIQQLERKLATVASSQDWKDATDAFNESIGALGNKVLHMNETITRKLNDSLHQDLKKAQQWRDTVEKNFTAQLKLMDERMAIIQDDMYQVRTGHGLELNELEDRFDDFQMSCERALDNTQSDVKRLLKRSNDVNDRLDLHDSQIKDLQKFTTKEKERLDTTNETVAELTEDYGVRLGGLDEEMDNRKDDHLSVVKWLTAHDDKNTEIDSTNSKQQAELDSHTSRLEDTDDKTAKLRGDVNDINNVHLSKVRKDLQQTNDDLTALSEGTTKSVNGLKAALEKTNGSLTATNKELKSQDSRLTQEEDAHIATRKDLKGLDGKLDTTAAAIRGELADCNKRCDEITTVKEQLAMRAAQIADLTHVTDQHRNELDEAKKNTDALNQGQKDLYDALERTARGLEDTFRQDCQDIMNELKDLRVEGSARDKALFNLSQKVDENERIARMHRDKDSEVRLWQEELARADVEFEADAVPEKAPQLEAPQVELISRHAQNLAEYFAGKADFEAIRQYVTGNDPENFEWEEDQIDIMRHELTEDFLVSLFVEVGNMNPQPTKVMMEARAKFKNKLRKAIETALSKFEQVEVNGSSRVQTRSLKPACVACDRPLNARRKVKDGPSAHTGPMGRPTTAPSPAVKKQFGASGSMGGNSRMDRGEVGGRSGGFGGEYGGEDTRATFVPGGSAYVYRGGFRMPRNDGDLGGGGPESPPGMSMKIAPMPMSPDRQRLPNLNK